VFDEVENMDKRDIILITVDCLRADHVKYMKKLMERKNKIVFENMFSNATYTGLSVPSFLTSTYPPLEKPRATIAYYLKENRYQTAAFVPNALLLNPRYRKLRIENGFDFYRNYLKEDISGSARMSFNKLLTGIKDAIKLFSKYIPQPILRALPKGVGFMPLPVWLPYPRAKKVLDDAKNWFLNAQKPRFMWIHLMDAHSPYLPPEEYISVDKNIADVVNRRLRFVRSWLPKEDVDILHKLYIDNIRYTSDSINNFIDEVVDENTIVFITADHGEQFLEHGKIGHITSGMYDEQLHIPLLILNGGFDKNEKKLVSLIDVSPTIIHMAGVEMEGLVGDDVLSKNYKEKPVFFAGYDKKWNVLYGIRTKEWKLFRGTNGWELYDLIKDPKEKNNVYAEEPEMSLKLKTKLLEILETKNKIENENRKLEKIIKKLKSIENE